MLVATWNINSIKTRLPHVLNWLDTFSPDVLCLQEIKCTTDTFPKLFFEERGYACAVFGQKTYNGVAILSKIGLEDVVVGNEYFDDPQARLIDVVVQGHTRIVCLYAPNGQQIGSDKFEYKEKFYQGLIPYLSDRLRYDERFILTGDFNIAPSDLDVYDPTAFSEILCTPQERSLFRSLVHLGLHDAMRIIHPNRKDLYTWWDYRNGSFEKNFGVRIDHFLISSNTLNVLEDAGVDLSPRALEKPSDHTPVWIRLQKT